MSMDGISGQPQDWSSLGGTMDEKTKKMIEKIVKKKFEEKKNSEEQAAATALKEYFGSISEELYGKGVKIVTDLTIQHSLLLIYQ